MILIFTPTRLPGIDVTVQSILRQKMSKHKLSDIVWLVADELYSSREKYMEYLKDSAEFHVMHCKLPKIYMTNLAHCYNYALQWAQNIDAELFISLQDYVYIPSDGVQKFLDAMDEFPDCLYTGPTHLMTEPTPDAVANKDNPLSVWKDGLTARTQPSGAYFYKDARLANGNPDRHKVHPRGWETNWSAASRAAIRAGIRMDETYDAGRAFENQDYAYQAHKAGMPTVFDPDNVAWGVHHKAIWPEIEAREIDLSRKNMEMHLRKWGE